MTPEQQSVRDWMKKAGQETPGTPTIPSFEVRKLRARLILEEAFETIQKGLGLEIEADVGGFLDIDDLDFISSLRPNLVELADGLADLQVVNLGTAVACGIDLEPVFSEVMRSNNSKWWKSAELDTPAYRWDYHFDRLEGGLLCVTDAGGKVIKSPSYSPANIAPILEGMKG